MIDQARSLVLQELMAIAWIRFESFESIEIIHIYLSTGSICLFVGLRKNRGPKEKEDFSRYEARELVDMWSSVTSVRREAKPSSFPMEQAKTGLASQKTW